MLISLIKQTSPGRLTVCLEDGSEIKSTLGVVTDMRLFSGRDLDGDSLEHLRADSLCALAREKALELLSLRPMSCKELETKLKQKGIHEDTASFCVRWLEENKLIDDESYAAAVARHYTAKGYGPGRIRSELSRRGIPRELWDEAVAALPEDTSKIDKFISSRLTDLDDRDQVRKVSAALYRRGYSWEEIRRALGRFNAECEE